MDPKDEKIQLLEGRVLKLQTIIENLKSWIYQRIDETIPDDILSGTTVFFNIKECHVVLNKLPKNAVDNYNLTQFNPKSDAGGRPLKSVKIRCNQPTVESNSDEEFLPNLDDPEYADSDGEFKPNQQDLDLDLTKPFKCPYSNCGSRYKAKKTLSIHVSQVHERKDEIKCPHCSKIHYHHRALAWHIRSTHSGLVEKKKKTKIKKPKINHEIKIKTEKAEDQHSDSDEENDQIGAIDTEGLFTCTISDCKRKFKSQSSLKRHEMAQHDRSVEYKCDFAGCGKIFYHQKHLYWHKKCISHTSNKAKAQKSSKKAKRTATTNSNSEAPAEGEKEKRVPGSLLKCTFSDCDKTFKHTSSLNVHKAQVHERVNELLCTFCPKIFYHPSTLEDHIRIVHRPAKEEIPSICDICGKSYKKARYLRDHIRNVHTDKPKEKIKSIPLKTHDKFHYKEPRICTVCGKGFMHASTYSKHMIDHKNERKYKCETCFKGFNHASNLMYHRLTHFPPEFPCDECNKSFYRPESLRIHVSTVHSTATPFECQVCESRFKIKRQLTLHQIKLNH